MLHQAGVLFDLGPFFFEGTVTGEAYLEMLRLSILPDVRTFYENSEVFYQQDGAPPHYHLDVRAPLDENLQGHWIGRRGIHLNSHHVQQI